MPQKTKQKETATKATIPAKEKKAPAKKNPAYSHPSKKRCPAPSRAHASFSGVKCGHLMKAVKTYGPENSKKQWKCPVCKKVVVTAGEKI